uniref:Uncharacterized protein n=1 Tax=Cacopsylla melanoneura TaxID=428564 RepID=A0A8D9B753_9HEMI
MCTLMVLVLTGKPLLRTSNNKIGFYNKIRTCIKGRYIMYKRQKKLKKKLQMTIATRKKIFAQDFFSIRILLFNLKTNQTLQNGSRKNRHECCCPERQREDHHGHRCSWQVKDLHEHNIKTPASDMKIIQTKLPI